MCSDCHISVIIPVYTTAETLPELYRRLCQVLKKYQATYELIFVDDASIDDSLQVLEIISRDDPGVILVSLEKNVGQHRAIMYGLSCCSGEWAIVMDADLQDSPEVIPSLLSKGLDGYDAVFAARRGMHESPFRMFSSLIFKGFLHVLCGVHPDTGTFVAMSRNMVNLVLNMRGSYPYLPGMIHCSGLRITSIPASRSKRQAGKSSYSFRGRVWLAWRALSWVTVWKIRRLFLRP